MARLSFKKELIALQRKRQVVMENENLFDPGSYDKIMNDLKRAEEVLKSAIALQKAQKKDIEAFGFVRIR